MLLNQVKGTIEHYRLLEKGDRLVVGVSGGVDSMVLLHLLSSYRQELGLFLIVAHVNHGLRPDESEKEAELVKNESERLGLPFEYGQFNVREFKRAGGLSVQDAGRRIRFHFFKSLLLKYDAQKIALGHNAEDQVETVLLRLIRGSGIKGLKGMLPIREGRVVRPLLEVWRREIESFARENKIPFLLDSSNLKRDYLRNRIRLSLIPLIEKEYQPDFKTVIMRTSAILREEDDYIEKGVEEAYQKIVHEEEGNLSFKLSKYQSLHQAIQWRLIRKVLGKTYSDAMAIGEEEWSNVGPVYRRLSEPPPSFSIELPHGLSFEKRYDMVSVREGREKPVPPFEVELASPGRTFVEEIGREVVVEETSREKSVGGFNGPPDVAFLDFQTLEFPLKIRNFRPGDRFQPLGTKGTQKVKEFFIDHKIPRFERPNIPLLVSGKVIAWIGGYRIDERVKVTDKTKKVLRIELLHKK